MRRWGILCVVAVVVVGVANYAAEKAKSQCKEVK